MDRKEILARKLRIKTWETGWSGGQEDGGGDGQEGRSGERGTELCEESDGEIVWER